MNKYLLTLSMIFYVITVSGGTFSSNTGIVVSDTKGNSYNIDSLLKAGKHIVVHQTFAG